jgi:hypothetical protein
MKNVSLVAGIVLVVLNTMIGIILRAYSDFNMVFVDLSLILSTGIIYYLLNNPIADGFKIGAGFFMLIGGILRVIFAILSPNQLENNLLLILFISFLSLEIIVIFIAKRLSLK